MNILVCIKQILDPGSASTRLQDQQPKTKEAERGGANLVTNIFCENALETALQLKEKAGDGSRSPRSATARTTQKTLCAKRSR